METITTYLNGNVTLFDIAAVIVGWLLLNIGFVLGAGWQHMHRKPEPRQSARPGYIELSGDEYHAVRCTMRSPEDVARRAGAV